MPHHAGRRGRNTTSRGTSSRRHDATSAHGRPGSKRPLPSSQRVAAAAGQGRSHRLTTLGDSAALAALGADMYATTSKSNPPSTMMLGAASTFPITRRSVGDGREQGLLSKRCKRIGLTSTTHDSNYRSSPVAECAPLPRLRGLTKDVAVNRLQWWIRCAVMRARIADRTTFLAGIARQKAIDERLADLRIRSAKRTLRRFFNGLAVGMHSGKRVSSRPMLRQAAAVVRAQLLYRLSCAETRRRLEARRRAAVACIESKWHQSSLYRYLRTSSEDLKECRILLLQERIERRDLWRLHLLYIIEQHQQCFNSPLLMRAGLAVRHLLPNESLLLLNASSADEVVGPSRCCETRPYSRAGFSSPEQLAVGPIEESNRFIRLCERALLFSKEDRALLTSENIWAVEASTPLCLRMIGSRPTVPVDQLTMIPIHDGSECSLASSNPVTRHLLPPMQECCCDDSTIHHLGSIKSSRNTIRCLDNPHSDSIDAVAGSRSKSDVEVSTRSLCHTDRLSTTHAWLSEPEYASHSDAPRRHMQPSDAVAGEADGSARTTAGFLLLRDSPLAAVFHACQRWRRRVPWQSKLPSSDGIVECGAVFLERWNMDPENTTFFSPRDRRLVDTTGMMESDGWQSKSALRSLNVSSVGVCRSFSGVYPVSRMVASATSMGSCWSRFVAEADWACLGEREKRLQKASFPSATHHESSAAQLVGWDGSPNLVRERGGLQRIFDNPSKRNAFFFNRLLEATLPPCAGHKERRESGSDKIAQEAGCDTSAATLLMENRQHSPSRASDLTPTNALPLLERLLIQEHVRRAKLCRTWSRLLHSYQQMLHHWMATLAEATIQQHWLKGDEPSHLERCGNRECVRTT